MCIAGAHTTRHCQFTNAYNTPLRLSSITSTPTYDCYISNDCSYHTHSSLAAIIFSRCLRLLFDRNSKGSCAYCWAVLLSHFGLLSYIHIHT